MSATLIVIAVFTGLTCLFTFINTIVMVAMSSKDDEEDKVPPIDPKIMASMYA